MNSSLKAFKGLWAKAMTMDTVDLVIKATLLVAIFNAEDNRTLLITMIILCPIGFFAANLHRNILFWSLLTGVQAAAVYYNWFSVDNHKYLLVYWSLAITLALCARQPSPVLALNGRALLGLVFGLATMWKVLSPDYLSGSFFHYHLLLDQRFWPVTSWGMGISRELLVDNYRLYTQWTRSGASSGMIQLHSSTLVAWAAHILTWWTITLEALISVAFLLPDKSSSPCLRNRSLWLFAVTTYLCIPIIGFGSLLLVIGLAQTDPTSRNDRRIYLALLLASPFYLVLWKESFNYIFGIG